MSRTLRLARSLPSPQLEATCRALEELRGDPTENAVSAAVAGVLNPHLRAQAATLIRLWSQEGSALQNLAWTLRGAGAMDEWWVRDRRIDVAWTGPASGSSTFRRTEQALLEVLAAAQTELWLVSFAGYKLPIVKDALRGAAERGVAVRMVIESPEESKGKVTISTLEGLGARLAEVASVYVWPTDRRPKNDAGNHGSLHVKCALADDTHFFVSSANLTDYAMSLNMELGILTRGGNIPRSVREHFRWLVS